MEIIQKTCPGYPGSIVVPLYTARKTEQMETVAAYFLKNLPLLTGTFWDAFRTGPAGIFQNPFYVRQLAQPGASVIQWRRKTSSHIP